MILSESIFYIMIFFAVLVVFLVIGCFFYKSRKKGLLKTYVSTSKIFGAFLIPLVIGYLGYHVQFINQNLEFQKNDLSIIKEFKKSYFDDNTIEISVRFISLLKSEDAKIELRKFVIYNLMKRIIMNPNNKNQKYEFDITDENYNKYYYILGDNLDLYFKENKPEAKNSFRWLINNAWCIHYNEYSTDKNYDNLIRWLWKQYINENNFSEKELKRTCQKQNVKDD